MATILYGLYQGDNFRPNATLPELTFSAEGTVDETNINSLLPNNGVNYKTVDYVGVIPTGTSATIYTETKMVVASFIAELGELNSETNRKEGKWKILASVTLK